ncbi:hypothetical protein EC991_001284 [Linnemannia zychae]|nr:hypothetical protein EC991_001284 [Linnemannia zychae]
MSVLRDLYPGIICLHVDGQEIQPRRGLPTAPAMSEVALSQWIGDETVVTPVEGEGVDDLSSPGGEQQSIDQKWIEYRPDSIVQVVYYTSDPLPNANIAESQQSGTEAPQNDADFPLSFWARIRQEIRAAIQQYQQDMAIGQAQTQGANNDLSPRSSASLVSSCIEIPRPTAQTPPHSVISLSSSSSTPSPGSSHDSQSEGMEEDAADFSALPVNFKSKGKDRKRDRDEEKCDDSSSTTSGSEKRWNYFWMWAFVKFRLKFRLRIRLKPSRIEFGRVFRLMLRFRQVFFSIWVWINARFRFWLKVNVYSAFKSLSVALGLNATPGMPVIQIPADEPGQLDRMMVTSATEANQIVNNLSDNGSDEDESDDDEEEDSTQPFRFTDHQLQDFVAKRKGLLARDLQAVVITLKSNKEARRFYKFLTSQDYTGRWLNIKLAWNWSRDELSLLVQALTNSPIEILLLDGCCDRPATAPPPTADTPNTKYSILTLPSTTPQRVHQTMDNKTKSLRYDPIIRLFRNSQFRELHFYGLPNLLQHSSAPLPWALSHLHSFRLHAQIDNWEQDGFQANRFIGFVQRAVNLEHLYVDCLTDQYYIYMDKIEWALNQSRRNKDSPSLDIHFQHHIHRQTLLRIKYNQWDREIKEFEVDLMGTSSESDISWKQVLEQKADGALESLVFKNMTDERWMGIVMDWVIGHTNNRGLGLRHLQLDCVHFGPIQFHDLVEFLELTRPRLQTLDLCHVCISFPRINSSSSASQSLTPIDRDLSLSLVNDTAASSETITWPTLIKALNISVLLSLCVSTSNLQDRDINGIVDCLRAMALNCKKVALEKLLLRDAQLSVHGERTLVKEVQVFLPGVDVKFR